MSDTIVQKRKVFVILEKWVHVTEEKRVIHPASVLLLFGLALGIAAFITSSYMYRLPIHDSSWRIIAYLITSFPIPIAVMSFLSGYRYGEDAKEKAMEDLLLIVICLAIIFLYAIIQASPGELGIVILKGVVFLLVLFGCSYFLAKLSYNFGSTKNEKKQI